MSHLNLFLGLRYLRSRKIVLLSIAAVAMSCALLITVASLFTGFIAAFERGADEHLGDVILSAPGRAKIPEFDGLIERLVADPNIAAATAVVSGQGLLMLEEGNVRAVQVWGIELPRRNSVTPLGPVLLRQKDAAEPSFATDDVESEACGFVGIGVLASPDEKTDEYDIESIRRRFLGRKVVLTTGRAVPAESTDGASSGRDAVSFKRTSLKFTISDVVFTGVFDLDNNYIYLPLETLCEKLYPGEGRLAQTIQVRLAPGIEAERGRAAVERIWNRWAAGRLAWAPLATVSTSRQLQARLIAEYHKQMQMLMLIFGVVSAGAVLLIFCIFYLIVMTRQKDIAIVKSCGVGSPEVARLYVSFAMTIGVLGAALGLAMGYVITQNINPIERWISIVFGLKLWKSSTYMFSRIPNQIDWGSVAWIAAAAVAAAAIGAIIPAITAARVRPVRILRYE